jgi:hypothetical protein
LTELLLEIYQGQFYVINWRKERDKEKDSNIAPSLNTKEVIEECRLSYISHFSYSQSSFDLFKYLL